MSDFQEMLVESAQRLFARQCTTAELAQANAGEWCAQLWQATEDIGLPAAMDTEARGGIGLGPLDALPLLKVAGQHALPLPLGETMVARWLAGLAGLPIEAGPLSIAPTHPADTLSASRQGQSWRISGTAHRVPWASAVGRLVVIADSAQGPVLALLDARQAQLSPGSNLAAEPRDTVRFQDAPAIAAAASPFGADDLRAIGAVARSAQMAGACEQIMRLAVDYANLRVQFGRPIGKFQAVQQNLANLTAQVAAASAAADLGIEAVANGFAPMGVATAKIRAGEAAGMVAAIAHQTFGAIGFTQEHSLHFLTRRIWSWRDEFGSESYWAQQLGRRVVAGGARNIWKALTT